MGKITVTVFALKGLISLSQRLTIKRGDNEESIRIEYKGGSSNGKIIRGGRYISKDSTITEAIKNSQRFKNGQIVVEKETKEDSDTASVVSAVIQNTGIGVNDSGVNPDYISEDVTSTQKAKEFMFSKGVSQEELNTVISAGDVAKLAKTKGFYFPNWDAFKDA